ncbi:MAG TPA: PQQ-binding-like beta-propeller repeat protein [Gaiellaceae bacterium]|nr:PQQ-binding-like beta-propeller repeat protein [Gaiellaceae bacterium]
MTRVGLWWACALAVAALASGVVLGGASARTTAADVGWGGFGNTPDELRHSPLTLIDPSNVSKLGRLFTVDFRQIDSSVRRGEQSYPVESNGTLYLTTNDDNVWALDATTGKVKWRWTPDNVAVFRNFGIVANRGVALCDNHVFVLTLDMTIASLDPATGQLQKRVAIAQAVPGASSSYGYSETSAPICADHRLIVGAAGSEYGVRGFVMAYHTNLTPAWPNPFWTIPPAGTSWRRYGTLVGGGVVWTPTTVDPTTNTLYFGTGSATPLYFPSIRPGSNPRADSLVAVNLSTGRMKWWQQQMAFNEWAYDTAQPPLVYTAKVGGRTQRIVSVATMEGVWFAYDATTGRPIYQRVKVIDRTEHPALQPGKAVAVFPSALGGLNYSPASFDPHTNYVFNAAAETAALDTQAQLTPTQKKRKFNLGDVFLGLSNGNFGTVLPGWHDHGSISAINVNTGARVWKFTTPEPERGGVTTTASGLGFAGDGDGVLRAFDLKTGKILWTFQTGAQIASGASIYSVDGKEYVAITVGGTPTSSGGGTASQLQVFGLGGSQQQSQPPSLPANAVEKPAAAQPAAQPVPAAAPAKVSKPAAPRHRAAPAGFGTVATPGGLVVQPWLASSSNVKTVLGRVLWNGVPVVGAHVVVDGFPVPQATSKNGTFPYDVDITLPLRHAVHVTGVSSATVRGKPLSAGQQSALAAASGGFSVAYGIHGLAAHAGPNGTVVVTGRVADTAGTAPPPVRLLTYQLSGTVTDASGKPVQGAVVITRTQDRDFWTHSSATDANGRYTSFFAASDETAADPVPLAVGVALGSVSYGGTTGTNAPFARLKSATMNIQLGSGANYTIQKPTSYTGAVYTGLVLGVTAGGKVVKPVAERWPDAKGRFSMTLPASVRGKTVHLWENQRQSFSRFPAKPGGAIDLATWPTQLGSGVPSGLASLTIPG